MGKPTVILDDAAQGNLRRFRGCVRVVRADEPEEVQAALTALSEAMATGKYAAGYFSYELGYLLEPRLSALPPAGRKVPLLWFGIFEACEEAGIEALQPQGRAYAGPLAHEWDVAQYRARFDRVREWIAAGDLYQANLSFRSRFHFAGDAMALYLALRDHSGAAHCAYIDDGERQILSLSPELFFDLSRDGALTAKPMKGTAARAKDASADAAARAHLAASAKDRAENLMIVDLLRNDLGRIAQTGSVAVADLFAIETYPTVHQMVSTVTARLKPGMGIAEIVRALFPCGSVTGAPKIRAMEVIRELEQSPRGVYCGAIGYFAPDGSTNFNVAIRTLTIEGHKGELGIGGAVVHDSLAAAEYAECLLKARYYETARKPLELIETLRYEPHKGFTRADRHLARMKASASFFHISFNEGLARRALDEAVHDEQGALRVRLTLNEAGGFACTNAPLGEAKSEWTFTISDKRVESADILLRHKTNWRELYESEFAACVADEVIFLNERGELTEGSRTNIFARIDGRLLTPRLSSGLLNGCLRAEILANDECEERVLRLDDLARAKKIYLGNSLRGLILAKLKTIPE
ncbi:MAG TPA: aminodeoxychorismate synthase component I [Rhizomicrobium sp.]|jgi:para-aminobenzoate synthetase/4-amino-4-deoxychorismate lyase|nr:aminodeoxychorismate synthase component I [Rhizomicrobium sp.]